MPKSNLEEITPAELVELARRVEDIASSLRDSAESLEDAGIALIELATQTARTRIGQLESFAGSAAKTTRRTVNAVREQAAKDRAKVARAAEDGVRYSTEKRKKKR